MAVDRRGKQWITIQTILFVIGFAVLMGMYFGIFHPLVDRDWKKATCTVVDMIQYTQQLAARHIYNQYKLAVEVDGKYYPGYACESNLAQDETATQQNGVYPYQFMKCDEGKEGTNECLSDQIFIPVWFCLRYDHYQQFEIGDKTKCWYNVQESESYNGSTGANLRYPKQNDNFIIVLLRDGTFVKWSEYIVMWIIPFGFLMVIPILCIPFCAVPMLWGKCTPEWWHDRKEEFLNTVVDFWYFNIMKKKGYIRRKRRKQLERAGGNYFEKVQPFMHVYQVYRDSHFKFSATMAREVTKFIAELDPIEEESVDNAGDLELSNISAEANN